MPASPFASRGSERPIQMERLSTPPLEILPGNRATRHAGPLAACLRLRGRLTRAMTDSHRAALLTRLASSASTRHQPFAAPRSRLAIRPLAAKRSPASISISIASRVDAAGSRKRRGGLPSSGQRRLKRPRSMARGHRIIHTAGLHRESIASVLLPSNLESPWGWVSLPFPSEDSIP